MPTNSENLTINPSENFNTTTPLSPLSPVLTNNIEGVLYNLNVVQSTPSPLSPNGLIFSTPGVSNGLASAFNGITDFTAYNDYIHYTSIPPNVRVNVFGTLVRASFRFQIYSRQYR